jgi:hypothetical protein
VKVSIGHDLVVLVDEDDHLGAVVGAKERREAGKRPLKVLVTSLLGPDALKHLAVDRTQAGGGVE